MLLRSLIILSFLVLFFGCNPPTTPSNASQEITVKKNLVSEIDTFYGGKNLLFVSDTTQIAFESNFKFNNDTNEASNLNRDAAFVTRMGDSLIFKLEKGNKILLNKGSEADDFENYKYIGKLKDINSYLVFASFWESYSFLVVNAKTGHENYLCGFPEVSPNKKHVAAAGFDLQAGFVFNGIQMYDVTPDSLKPNWNRELSKWGANNLTWLDNDNLMLEKMSVDTAMQVVKSYIKLSSAGK
jgi:hypothetical protein